MKSVYALTAVLVVATASPAFAQEVAGVRIDPPANPIYVGLRAGMMDASGPGLGDDAGNVAVLGGYEFHQDERGTFFGEGEYSRSFSDGNVPGGGEFDVETLGAYAGFRSAGPWYWKAKAGFTFFDIGVTGTVTPAEEDETSLSFGIGGGGWLNNQTGVEVEYTFIDSDLDFISVGVITRF